MRYLTRLRVRVPRRHYIEAAMGAHVCQHAPSHDAKANDSDRVLHRSDYYSWSALAPGQACTLRPCDHPFNGSAHALRDPGLPIIV